MSNIKISQFIPLVVLSGEEFVPVVHNGTNYKVSINDIASLGVGSVGPPGPAGPAGIMGTSGAAGSVWRDGSGVPSNALGVNGDYYLNVTSGDVFLKTAGVYNIVTNIRGTNGIDASTVFDLTAFYPGTPPASAIVTQIPVARVITFQAGLTGSYGKASTAATAQTDFDFQKNGVSVGTLRFAAAATTATFIVASPVVTTAGDVLSIVAPTTPDTTIANVGFVLAGTR